LPGYSDEDAAALYDLLNRWGPGDQFYLDLVMDADTVLDVGCGTGAILKRARQSGHSGRLSGVDPDAAMLAVARRRSDIEWHHATAASLTRSAAFDLAIMSGHAFQCLISDDELRASLAAIRNALIDGGRFAFETRNPLVRAWEGWTDQLVFDVVDPADRHVRVSYELHEVSGDLVIFSEITSDGSGVELRRDRATLRFLDVAALNAFLTEAGFHIAEQFGDWSRAPLTSASPEIITIARR
jgi:SAM-dependent methyltransferase